MHTLFQAIDDFLRGRAAFAPEAPLARRMRWLVVLVITCGPLYGAVMGTFSGFFIRNDDGIDTAFNASAKLNALSRTTR